MRFEVLALGELSALGRFEFLHGGAVTPRLLGTERVDRIDVAVAVVPIDLCSRQLLAHEHNPMPRSRWCRQRQTNQLGQNNSCQVASVARLGLYVGQEVSRPPSELARLNQQFFRASRVNCAGVKWL